MKQPWMKFYPADWRSDPALRMCSVGARGLWMEMLCLMHDAQPCGSLLVNGKPVTPKQLAALAGTSLREVEGWLAELEEAGVFSRDDDGTIFSRRIRRDILKAETDRRNGLGGGNPRLKGGVNPPDKPNEGGGIKPRSQKQKPEAEAEANAAAQLGGGARVKRLEPHDDGPPDHVKTLRSCVEAIGAGHPADPVFGPIMLLVDRGIPLREILTVLRSESEARRARGRPPIKFWSKWAEIVVERLDAAPKVASRPSAPEGRVVDLGPGVTVPEATLRRVLEDGRWLPTWGPAPGKPGCRLPADLEALVAA